MLVASASQVPQATRAPRARTAARALRATRADQATGAPRDPRWEGRRRRQARPGAREAPEREDSTGCRDPGGLRVFEATQEEKERLAGLASLVDPARLARVGASASLVFRARRANQGRRASQVALEKQVDPAGQVKRADLATSGPTDLRARRAYPEGACRVWRDPEGRKDSQERPDATACLA